MTELKRPSMETKEYRLRNALAWLFVGVAIIFTFGLFYITVNAQELSSNIADGSEYLGEPTGGWEPAPDKSSSFKGEDIQSQVIDDKLYLQIKSVDKGKTPYIDSLRLLDDGSYLAYVGLEEGKDSTAVYELKVDEKLEDGAPAVSQISKGLKIRAEEVNG